MLNSNRDRFLRYAANSFAPLSQNSDHQFAMGQALKIYNSNVIYTFIPKIACSTMRVSLAIENGCIKNTSYFNWIHKNNTTFCANLQDLICAEYTFVILRSPLARLASVYLDKIVDRTSVAWHLYDILHRTVELEKMTFREFVNIVTQDEYLRTDIHWRPQVDFLVYEKYDDYFILENFKQALPIIEEKAKLTIYDARNLTKHGTDQFTMINDKCYADTSANEISTMKKKGFMPSHNSLYDPILENKVEKAYEDDILLYKKYF